jgi:hypothetical protein
MIRKALLTTLIAFAAVAYFAFDLHRYLSEFFRTQHAALASHVAEAPVRSALIFSLTYVVITAHVYPTFSEANKPAAGAWKRAHAPQRVFGWVERYHAWMRG